MLLVYIIRIQERREISLRLVNPIFNAVQLREGDQTINGGGCEM